MEKPTNNQPVMPQGVRLLSFYNIMFPGVFWLVTTLLGFAKTEKIAQALNETIKQQGINNVYLSGWQVQSVFLLQAAIAVFFIITGIFLLKRKEWARKAVIKFCLFVAALLCLGAFLAPQMIGAVIINIIHPGVCILYLTGATAAQWFNPTEIDQSENPSCCI